MGYCLQKKSIFPYLSGHNYSNWNLLLWLSEAVAKICLRLTCGVSFAEVYFINLCISWEWREGDVFRKYLETLGITVVMHFSKTILFYVIFSLYGFGKNLVKIQKCYLNKFEREHPGEYLTHRDYAVESKSLILISSVKVIKSIFWCPWVFCPLF